MKREKERESKRRGILRWVICYDCARGDLIGKKKKKKRERATYDDGHCDSWNLG